MKVGWVGLGRLGLPCALALAEAGHEVVAYDVVEAISQAVDRGDLSGLTYVEPGVEDLLKASIDGSIIFRVAHNVGEVVRDSFVVFVAVQTPHAPGYDGTVLIPGQTRDFEYGYLVQAVKDVAHAAAVQQREIVLVVVSTVLPGTTDRLLRPLLNRWCKLVYSPQFIAMGTTLRDFANPEFLLLGSDSGGLSPEAQAVSNVLGAVHSARRVPCSIVDAELTKVAYNTYISLKIVWANHLGAICDAVGADADTVVGALAMADERVISSTYLTPGMGDGGACHPRDLIALADLERRHELPGFFYGLAALRDEQTLALARTVVRWCEQTGLEPMVLGLGYKKDTPLTDGSPSLLLVWCIQQLLPNAVVESYDPLSSPASVWPDYTQPRVYVLAAKHSEFTETGIEFGPGSVVIDPWGVLPERCPGVVYVRPGRR